MSFFHNMQNAMADRGFPFSRSINQTVGEYHAFTSENGECKKKCCRYRLFENDLGAHFSCWRRALDVFWYAKDRSTFTLAESRQAAEERARYKRDQDERNKVLRDNAIIMASFLWNHRTICNASIDHPYVRKKKIIPYYARQLRSYLILRITDIEKRLLSLQYITAKGWKQFKKHASPKGGMLIMAEHIGKDDVIRICEGYSTGCSIYEAVGAPVIVAFSASNLCAVACAIRGKYPFNKIVICADNDNHLASNAGFNAGLHAAKLSDAKIVFPVFDKKYHHMKLTDFNDLFCLKGIEAVEEKLLTV